MTADIINLRKARKARNRADKEKRAEENRAKFGRTKADRQKTERNEVLTPEPPGWAPAGWLRRGRRRAIGMTRPVKRSFTIRGHRTSISLEAPFWDALKDASAREKHRWQRPHRPHRRGPWRGRAFERRAHLDFALLPAGARAVTSYDGGNRD